MTSFAIATDVTRTAPAAEAGAQLTELELNARAAGYVDDDGYFTQDDDEFLADLGA